MGGCAGTGAATWSGAARVRSHWEGQRKDHSEHGDGALHRLLLFGEPSLSLHWSGARPRTPVAAPTRPAAARAAHSHVPLYSEASSSGALNVRRRAAAMGRATDGNTGVMAQFLPRRCGGRPWTIVHGPCPPGPAPRPPGAVPSWLDALPAGSLINCALQGGIATLVVVFVHLCRPAR